MSGALCGCVARLGPLLQGRVKVGLVSPGLGPLLWARRLHNTPQPAVGGRQREEKEEEKREEAEEEREGSLPQLRGGYTLLYNPSSYRRPHRRNSGAPFSRRDEEQEEEQEEGSGRPALLLTPPSRWQGSQYSVSCSRRISSTKNVRPELDLCSRTSADPLRPAEPPPCSSSSFTSSSPSSSSFTSLPSSSYSSSAPDIAVDPRAFQRCRPEYSFMTLDLSKRPPSPSSPERTLLLLQRVSTAKMAPADVASLLGELGRVVRPDGTAAVRFDRRFALLLRHAADAASRSSSQQLLEALGAFVCLGLPSDHRVLGPYESQLTHHARAGELDLRQMLLAADLWRLLGRSAPRYLEGVLARVAGAGLLAGAGAVELVQLLYVMGEGRRTPLPPELHRPLEVLLERRAGSLEGEEVGAACLGLFKSQTALSEGAVSRLVDQACSQVASMSDFSLVNVLKLLRFSHLDHRAWLEVTAAEVPRRAPGMAVPGLMHVALACSALHYHDDRILDAVAERLPPLAPRCRSKDSAKLLWAFGSLGVAPDRCPGFYPSLTEALRQRWDEFQRYPQHLLTGLLGLAFVCQLPQDLLAAALSPDFVSLATSSEKLDLKKDLLTLDGTAALEFPGWSGPRLGRELVEEVEEELWSYARRDVCQKAEVLEAERALRVLLGGEEFVRKCMILPHTRSIDLEVHLDPAGRPVPLIPLTSETGDLTSSVERSPSSFSARGWEGVGTGVTLTEGLLAQLTSAARSPTLHPNPDHNPNLTLHTNPNPNLTLPPNPNPNLRRTEPDKGGGLFSGGVDLTDGLVGALTKPGHPRNPPPPRDSTSTAPTAGKVVKLAVQVSNRNHYCYRSQQLLGLHAMKRRQLVLAGYRVVELHHWDWFPLLRKSLPEKLAYLGRKVFSSLD